MDEIKIPHYLKYICVLFKLHIISERAGQGMGGWEGMGWVAFDDALIFPCLPAGRKEGITMGR